MKTPKTMLEHEVAISNPDKVYFPKARITKLEMVRYYLAVADDALRGVAQETSDPDYDWRTEYEGWLDKPQRHKDRCFKD